MGTIIFQFLNSRNSNFQKKNKKQKAPFFIFLIPEIIFGILEGQKLETIIFWFFSIFWILETLISGIKKIKKTEPFVFLFFLILKTLISRIKKIKKTEPFVFLIFLILKTLISRIKKIKKNKKIKKIIVSNFWPPEFQNNFRN